MFTKKWLSVLFSSTAMLGVGVGCASSDPLPDEFTGNSSQEALLAPCTAIPLATGSFLGCSAFDVTGVGFAEATQSESFFAASGIQTGLATQLNSVFGGLSVVPDIAASTVTISSTFDGFLPLFGADIILPLGADGFFSGIIPFAVDGLPGLALNVWGQFPIIDGGLATMPLTALNFSVGLADSGLLIDGIGAGFGGAAFLGSTFPLGFACNATVPLSCPGLAPAGFVGPALATPLAPALGAF